MQAIVRSFQAGLLQGVLDLRLLALQQLQRVGAFGRDVGRDLAVAIDIELDVDTPELGRIETDIELIGAGLDARGDRDCQSRDGNGRGRSSRG